MIGDRALSRRTFLRGAGAAIALPLLDAMLPESAFAAAKAPPVRMAFLFVANGLIKDGWTPQTEGTDYVMPSSLEAMKPLKDDFMVLSGLAQNQGVDNRAGDHARGTSAFLTGVRPTFTEGADIHLGASVDQIGAKRIGDLTRLPSLELGTISGKDGGSCDSGYSCAYSSNISWRTPTSPMAKEVNPRLVFERLFGTQEDADDKKSIAERQGRKKSVLDYVMDDASRLQSKLGAKDREKLDEYLYSVREVERRVTTLPLVSGDGMMKMEKPEGIPSDYGDHVRMMCDLMALAFQSDSTRIATFMFGLAGDNRSYRAIGVSDGHHDLSHHGGDPEKIAKIRKIDRYNVSLYASFIDRLKSIKEGNGTLLDNCMIIYGSELSDGNAHSHNDLPILLAGKGGGAFRTGRHIAYAPNTPLNNLFLAMLERVGAPTPSMGDSTGKVTNLT
jgi:hypothetical protein